MQNLKNLNICAINKYKIPAIKIDLSNSNMIVVYKEKKL